MAKKNEGNKKQSKLAKAVEVVPVMPQAELDRLSKLSIDADKAHGNTYTEVTLALRRGIPSNMKTPQAEKEYKRRVTVYAKPVAKSRGVEVDSILLAIKRYNTAAGWVAPKVPKDTSEQRELNKQSKERALRKYKQEIKAKNPKIDAEDLQTLAEERYQEMKDADGEAGKQKKARDKVIVKLHEIRETIKAGNLGNGDTKPALEALAAFIIRIEELA